MDLEFIKQLLGTPAGSAISCFGMILIPIFILIIYVVITGVPRANAYRKQAQSWSSTTGAILSSSIKVAKGGMRSSDTRSPEIIYQYEVNGQSYKNWIVMAGDHIMQRRFAGTLEEYIGRYPPGKSVTVYYNPANPKESALER